MIFCQSYEYIREKKYHAKKYSESKYLQIQSQHWGGERQLSMEVIDLEYFNNYDMVRDVTSNLNFFPT